MTAVEVNEHMCDVALDTIFCNGYASCCSVINKDVRNVKVQGEADQELGLAEKADLCIFEVSCSSLSQWLHGSKPRALWDRPSFEQVLNFNV